jgi:hypothetical protein
MPNDPGAGEDFFESSAVGREVIGYGLEQAVAFTEMFSGQST